MASLLMSVLSLFCTGWLQYKRGTEPEIRGPYNANRQSRYVELVLVIDNKEYTALGENLARVHQHCKDIANIINAVSNQGFYHSEITIHNEKKDTR